MYQQVAPIEIYINNSNKNHLICNQQTTIIYICVCIHTDTQFHLIYISYKKDTTNPENYSFIYNLLQSILHKKKKKMSLTVQKQRKQSLWWLSPLKTFSNRLLVGFQTTGLFLLRNYELFFWLSDMFTNRFLILSDILQLLQAIYNLKYDHPFLAKILELHMELIRHGKDFFFIWVPEHVSIRENSAADSRWRHLR